MRLAIMELKISLVHVLRRVRMVPCDETQVNSDDRYYVGNAEICHTLINCDWQIDKFF